MKTPLFSSPQASGGSAGTRWIWSYLVFSEKETGRGEQGGVGAASHPLPHRGHPCYPVPCPSLCGVCIWGNLGVPGVGMLVAPFQPLQSHSDLTQQLASILLSLRGGETEAQHRSYIQVLPGNMCRARKCFFLQSSMSHVLSIRSAPAPPS